MRIDYRQLERDTPEIAARVEAVSGLRVPLDTLSFEVANTLRERDYIFAEYLHAEGKIKVYQNNIPCLCSQNNANIILGHELMHHAQFSIEPFKRTVEKIEETGVSRNQLRPLRRLMEGDATWVQSKLEKFYSLDIPSRISGFPLKIILEYAGVFYEVGDSLDLYGLGKRRIDTLVATGGRAAVNSLYASDLLEIAENFNDSIIKKSITSGEKDFNATVDRIGDKIYRSIYRSETALEEATLKIEEYLVRVINDVNSKRLKVWLERNSKKDPEIAEMKRSYDEAMSALSFLKKK